MLISKSDFINLCKSMGKDPEFEKLRAEVLSILKKQAKTEGNEKDIHKSLLEMDKSFKYFDKDEFIIKSGYPVGTIREWKGRKYIKVAPNKWKPKYDSESKGAKNSITRLMKQVENCKNVEELMNLVMENKQRFTDANGNHLPIVDKLRAAADKKNDTLSSGGSSTEDKLSAAKKNLADATKRKAAIRDKYGVDSKEFEAAQKEENDAADKRNELLKQRESEAKERIHSRFSKKESEVKNTADENYIKNSNNKELKAKVNAAIKKYGVTGQNLMNVLYNKDKELYNELDKMGVSNAKQFIMQTNADNRNEESSKGEEKKDVSKIKEYSEKNNVSILRAYEIHAKDILTDDEKKFAEKCFENANSMQEFSELIDDEYGYGKRKEEEFRERTGVPKLTSNLFEAYILNVYDLDDKIEAFETKKKESEAEKHQNRSDAMKGNKNAYKGIAKEKADKLVLTKEKMLEKPISKIVQYANANISDYSSDDMSLDDMLKESFDTYKGSIELGEIEPEDLADRVGKYYARMQNHKIAREIMTDYNSGKLVTNDDGILVRSEKSESQTSAKDVKSMSDDELETEHKKVVKDIDDITKENESIYDKNSGWNRGLSSEDEKPDSDYQKWLKNGKKLRELKTKENDLFFEKKNRTNKDTKEPESNWIKNGNDIPDERATTTWKRDRKRKQKDVENFLGVKKGLFEEDEETDIAETVRSVLSEII